MASAWPTPPTIPPSWARLIMSMNNQYQTIQFTLSLGPGDPIEAGKSPFRHE